MEEMSTVERSRPEPPRPRTRDAAMNLCLWQVECGVSSKVLAAMVGCSKDHLSKIRRGILKPGRPFAVAFERVTGGRVTVESWDEK